MSRPQRYIQQKEEDIQYVTQLAGRSPLRRTPCKQQTQNKSPFRSRTPTRPLSPLRHQHALPSNIRYIANVSPLRDRLPEVDNLPDLSNGKSIKYIHGSKAERNFQTNRKNEYNKPSDRNFPEDNRLFGKMVDKLNSEKKGHLRGQNSHKTSVFADTETKPKVDPSLRPSGTFKQLVSLAKAGETKSDIKPRSRGREDPPQFQAEQENLSCLVYRMKSPRQEIHISQKPKMVINNHSSQPVRRKHSQADYLQRESFNEYRELDLLLDKIESGKTTQVEFKLQDYEVRGSINVRESLSMDPYL